MEIDIQIDSLTNCLENRETGAVCDTVIVLLQKLYLNLMRQNYRKKDGNLTGAFHMKMDMRFMSFCLIFQRRRKMIVAEKTAVTATSYKIFINSQNKLDRFGDAMLDGRLTEQSVNSVCRLRDAIMYSRQLGRPLTESEMKQFEI